MFIISKYFMAHTRNNNTVGNYIQQRTQLDYTHQRTSSRFAYTNDDIGLAGNGLLQGKIHAPMLSHNYIDVESSMRGLGLGNLEKMASGILVNDSAVPDKHTDAVPKQIPTNHLYKTPVVVMPCPLAIEKNQRPDLW